MLIMLLGLLWPLIYAISLMTISTMMVSNEPFLLQIVAYSAAFLIPLRGIYYIILSIANGNKLNCGTLIQTLMEMILAAIIVILPNFSFISFIVVYEIYLTFYIAIKFADTFIYGRNRIYKSMIPSLCQAVFFLHIFLAIIFMPDKIRNRAVEIGVAIHLSLFGIAHLCDFLSIVVKNDRAKSLFNTIRITMPGFIGLTIPHRLIYSINNSKRSVVPEKEPNAEIIFHFSKYGNGVAGHCELCIDGRTYTYGNYDPDSRMILRAAGNGIIIRAIKQDYIDWIVNSNHKMVIVYGLLLNSEQMASLREKLKDFDECMVSWDKEAKHTVSSEFIKKVTLNIDANIYKITKGRFKTYFLPTINCVTLTDSLLKNTPIGRTILPGISTPGSYLDILQRQYDTGSDFVVSLKTYGIK